MGRIAFVTAILSSISSVVQAQGPPVTPAQCEQWRQSLSRGDKLSPNDSALFVNCVSIKPKESWGNIKIAPPAEITAPVKRELMLPE
jgi:hypothetical protein